MSECGEKKNYHREMPNRMTASHPLSMFLIVRTEIPTSERIRTQGRPARENVSGK